LRGCKMDITEKRGIGNSLIKSYEILEEKFNQNEEKINELKAELSGGYKGKKEEKENYSREGLISKSNE